MSKRTTLFLVFITLIANISFANLRLVPSAYATIQSAINASVNGDTVLVSPGTYFENINYRGKNIVVTSKYFQTNDLSFVSNTIINGSTPVNTDSASCVRITSGEDSTTVLQGLTLTAGTGTYWADEHGGLAIFCEGGGVLLQNTRATVQYCIIKNNAAIRKPSGAISAGGGGIRSGDGAPKILNNFIYGNSGMYGGGIVLNYSAATIKNNVVYNNSVYQAVVGAPTFGGGGIWITGSNQSSIIINNTIINNSSAGSGSSGAGKGGGILDFASTISFRNNIVWNNTQTSGTSQIADLGGSMSVTYSDVQGGYFGSGNINAAPLFDSTNYYLKSGSPCIDKGDSSLIYNDKIDPINPTQALFPSKGSLRNDMGAYGGPVASVIGYSITGLLNGNYILPENFKLEQNYPNPFNPTTKINFSLSKPEDVKLQVFDSSGKEIALLANRRYEAGTFQIEFNASALASGSYFYKVTAGGESITKVMMLVK
ncbi:hypothetical protein BH10BAC5_BH10BAC5_26880 [soil metagenome]